MNKLVKRGLLGVAALSAPVSAALVLPIAASASPSNTVTATTHLSDRPDTCACTTNNPDQVWAYDNMSRQFTITNNHDGHYTVAITDNGSFSASSEPNSKDLTINHPISANGSVKGTQTIDVTATAGPNTSALPSQLPGSVSTSDMLSSLFPNGTIGQWDYNYNYHAGNQTYTQTTSSITGDITGK
jgi:hypothetical protein